MSTGSLAKRSLIAQNGKKGGGLVGKMGVVTRSCSLEYVSYMNIVRLYVGFTLHSMEWNWGWRLKISAISTHRAISTRLVTA
jgi:hypothetical protein